MWSAERHAGEAKRLERLGQVSEARAEWTQAAAKAEAVTLRHPRSRRAGDAAVLQAEALARSGACQDATQRLAEARERVTQVSQRERIDLAAAECAVTAGRPLEVDAALVGPLGSTNADRRSRAEYLAGEAATARMDFAAAVVHLNRSHEPGAREKALVAQQQAVIGQAARRSDLVPALAELSRLQHTERGTDDAGRLIALLAAVAVTPETPAARFHVAEVARDSLQAPLLAGELFLEAAGDTAWRYAPKALIAALSVLPERRDSIIAVLDSRYAGSPYTRAFHGEVSVAYAAAEDSLARELGGPDGGGRAHSSNAWIRVPFGAPVPGPRGPKLP
jgi:hypothetical protein